MGVNAASDTDGVPAGTLPPQDMLAAGQFGS